MKRRDFLKMCGVAIVAPSLPIPKAPAETLEITFDCAKHSATATCTVKMWGLTERMMLRDDIRNQLLCSQIENMRMLQAAIEKAKHGG